MVAKAHDRLRHGSTHCVVALVGPTGSGKSSVFNALAGAEISTSGVRRPTTAETHAVSWGKDASLLLDWLEVRRRHHAAPGDNEAFDGLVLLDLPDFDSTEAANRLEVDRLVKLVDLLIWVVEPQKYADQALHGGYLRPLAGYANVMRFVLSKTDTLSPDELVQAAPDFERLLQADGIAEPHIIATSVLAGTGMAELRAAVAQAVEERRSIVDRLRADIERAAISLGHHDSAQNAGISEVPKRARRELVDGLSRATGVDEAASVVARQYRRDAAAATGWPPTRWVGRFRRSPIRDLPRPGRSAVATAEVGTALRAVGDVVAEDLMRPWDASLRRIVLDQSGPVRAELAKVNVQAMRDMRKRPRWWSVINWLQRAVGLLAAAGAAWLIVLAVVGGLLRLETDAMTPMIWDWMPLPSLLLVGGGMVGIVLAFVARWFAVLGGKRRGRRSASIWRDRVEDVADHQVIEPVEAALTEFGDFVDLLAIAAGSTSPV